MTAWEPDQDLLQDTREIESSVKVIAERGRGTFIKKYRDLQHIMDHQAELQKEVKPGIGLKEGKRFSDLWFEVPVLRPRLSHDEGRASDDGCWRHWRLP
jgi:hypothetical protein